MLKYSTPEACGISSSTIEKFVRRLDENGYNMHSIMMSRKGQIFMEGYWAPFNSESMMRMNSITKSFVAIAIGLLCEEKKLSLSDNVADFFPEIPKEDISEYASELTIEDLLAMRTTSVCGGHWVRDGIKDRITPFFTQEAQRPRDTLFYYDTAAAHILCVIVEKITKMPFYEYMMDKALREIGFSEKTCCIKSSDGYSWGDSGLLCRTKDLHSFAEFVMSGGMYDGKRLMNEPFLRRAVSKISSTNRRGFLAHNTFGYGYQIWRSFEDGFAFFGMGDQLVICVPKKDFIFVCTADNQGNDGSRPVIMELLYHDIIKELGEEALPENEEANLKLKSYLEELKLVSIKGIDRTAATEKVDGIKYILNKNPMEIEYIKLNFDEAARKGVLEYKNKQGIKFLHFGINENVITEFPQVGYPDMQMGVLCEGNKYPCAVSAAWLEEREIGIKVQMIGKHLGGLFITIGFTKDYNAAGVYMDKNTNCFLAEYSGYAGGRKE